MAIAQASCDRWLRIVQWCAAHHGGGRSQSVFITDDMIKHPGYLGITSRGVILIHADWPAYAIEHGIGYSLLSLGQFPPGSCFTLLDDIDQCFLFVLGEAPARGAAFAEQRFHVAVWHEDVRALADAGYLVGGGVVPYAEWARRQINELQGLLWQRADGSLAPVPLPNLEDDEDFPPLASRNQRPDQPYCRRAIRARESPPVGAGPDRGSVDETGTTCPLG